MRILSLMVGSWMLVATCFGEGAPATSPMPPTDNVTIHVHGSVAEDCAVDFQLSGVGPVFTCNLADPITRFKGDLSTTSDGKLILEYTLGVSVPVKVGPATLQYKDFAIQGRVAIAYGEEIKIATVNGKDLVVAVSKYGKPKK